MYQLNAQRTALATLTLFFAVAGVDAQTAATRYRISILAGDTPRPDGVPARSAYLNGPEQIAVAGDGTVYFSDGLSFFIRKISRDGIVSTVAGTGLAGNGGDGGPAASAQIGNDIAGPVLDPNGNLYFGDSNSALRKIDSGGQITTIADFSGYGPPPPPNTGNINGVAVDAGGRIYVATKDNNVWAVGPDGGIQLIAGNGRAAHTGDGGPATSAGLDGPAALAADAAGNLYIAESSYRIRRVSPDGAITTVAGTGIFGYSGEGVPALTSPLGVVTLLAAAPDGTLYFTEESQNAILTPFSRLRKLTTAGKLVTIVGGRGVGYSSDGQLATEARIGRIGGLGFDSAGKLYFSDSREHRIQRVDSLGTLTTIAGAERFAGDGGSALSSVLNLPTSVMADRSGNVYVGESWGLRIRKIDPALTISTFAGNGEFGDYGDGLPADAASFSWLNDMALLPDGSLLVADFSNHRVRKVDPSGIITTFAGTGQTGGSGDGGPAMNAQLTAPFGIAVDQTGNVYISETLGHRIRKVTADGKITTIAGNGRPGFSGDGGSSRDAQLAAPRSILFDSQGSLWVADSGNNRVRRITPDGVIRTMGGNGRPGWSGDGGSAADASIAAPFGLAVDSSGAVLFTSALGARGGGIRRLRPDGTIDTVAGSLAVGATAAGACAGDATFDLPSSIAVDTAGRILVADRFNNRILALIPVEDCPHAAEPQ